MKKPVRVTGLERLTACAARIAAFAIIAHVGRVDRFFARFAYCMLGIFGHVVTATGAASPATVNLAQHTGKHFCTAVAAYALRLLGIASTAASATIAGQATFVCFERHTAALADAFILAPTAHGSHHSRLAASRKS